MPSPCPVKMCSCTQVHLVRAVKLLYSIPWVIVQEMQQQGVRWSCVSGVVLLLFAQLQTGVQFLAKEMKADRPINGWDVKAEPAVCS